MAKSKKPKKVKKQPKESPISLVGDLDSFNNGFFEKLAGTPNYEIVPTLMEDGTFLSKEQYAMVQSECSRLGLKVIFQVPLLSGRSIFLNPENLKVGYIDEGIH